MARAEATRHVIAAGLSALVDLPWPQLSRSGLVAFLVTAAMLSFAPLVPEVRSELGINNTWAGVLTAATVLTHTIMQLPSGQITDSLGARRSIAVGLSVVGIAVIGSGLAPSFETLLGFRLLLGMGTSISFVAALTYTSWLVAPEKRVLAQSAFGAASHLGVLVMLVATERLTSLGGWRGALVVEGLAIILGSWVVVAGLKGRAAHRAAPSLNWRETLSQRVVLLVGLAHAITYGTFMGVTAWAVTFLWQRHGVGLEWAGPLSALLTLSSIVGRMVGGYLSIGRERTTIFLCCGLAAAALGVTPLLPSLVPALIAFVVFGWFLSIPFGANFTYASLVTGRPASGREMSAINFIGNLGALSFPPLVGLALDLTGSFTVGFGLLAGIGLCSALILSVTLPYARR
ncbi:MAG: MFS transporter [Chloroflexota bacterium]